MQSETEVVIIGGGVMGCSLAWHLTRYGLTDVVLIEKNELTAGSTWHAAGLCTHYAHNATVMNLRAHSVKLYNGELTRDTGQPVSFHATGALRVTTKPDRLDEFKQVQGIGKFVGHQFNILSPAELKDIYPLVDTTNLVGAIHEPFDGYVDPSQATHAFAHGARQRGATIQRQTKVTGITRDGNEWRISTDKGDISCKHVVNAAGTWCREIGELMGVDLPVVPMLHQYIVTDTIETFANLPHELPFIRDPDESWYLRQERDGIIIGPYEKNGQAWSIDGVPPEFGMELLPPELDRIESIAAAAMQRVPAASEGGIKTIVNGPITFTPDANPLIGPAFAQPNAWLLTGSSMGVMEGGGAGDFLAKWIIDGTPPADPLAIDARRFGGYADRDYRVSKAVECFAAQFGIHYPFEERPAGRNKRLTAVHAQLSALNAEFGSAYGWERPNYFASDNSAKPAQLSFKRPNWFQSVADECEAASERVAIADLGIFSKFTVTGSDATEFINTIGCNIAPAPGRVNLNLVLTTTGGVLLEFSVTCQSDNRFLLVTAAAAERIAEDFLTTEASQFCNAAGRNRVTINNCTESLAAIALMGPEAENVLQSLTDTSLKQTDFRWLSTQSLTVNGIHTTALRVSYIGENGWELYVPAEQQSQLFKTLHNAGKPFDIKPYGAFAMNAMRLEKGYRAWGLDYTTERTPLEAGMNHLVKTEGREFTGRQALLNRADNQSNTGTETHWSMHLMSIDTTGVDPFYTHTILQNGKPIGVVTSGAYGHRCNTALALGYLRQQPTGDPLNVEILGNPVAATILDQIPYDPTNARLRS
jgi:dimethylglycine dehydrogenase